MVVTLFTATGSCAMSAAACTHRLRLIDSHAKPPGNSQIATSLPPRRAFPMPASSSDLQLIAILPSPSTSEPRAERQSRALFRLDKDGAPGKTLGRAYTFVGAKVGGLVNEAVRGQGKGPGPAAETILQFFSQEEWKEDSVHNLHSRNQIPVEVLNACSRLVKFAFRAEMPKTQYAAFRKLVILCTQFPGLKTLFEQSDHLSAKLRPPATRHSQKDVFQLWDRPQADDTVCDSRWHFFCEFAAACIADQTICSLIEGYPPSALSSAVAHVSGLSFIEHLLNASVYDPQAPFSSHLSIRYLGGILNLKHFWEHLRLESVKRQDCQKQCGQLHSGILDKLLKRAEQLLQDLGLDDSDADTISTKAAPFKPLALDEEGADAYCAAVLIGLQASVLEDLPKHMSIRDQVWYRNLRSVVGLLRQHKGITLLPRSRDVALNEIYGKHLAFRLEEQEVVDKSETGSLSDRLASNISARSPSPQNDAPLVTAPPDQSSSAWMEARGWSARGFPPLFEASYPLATRGTRAQSPPQRPRSADLSSYSSFPYSRSPSPSARPRGRSSFSESLSPTPSPSPHSPSTIRHLTDEAVWSWNDEDILRAHKATQSSPILQHYHEMELKRNHADGVILLVYRCRSNTNHTAVQIERQHSKNYARRLTRAARRCERQVAAEYSSASATAAAGMPSPTAVGSHAVGPQRKDVDNRNRGRLRETLGSLGRGLVARGRRLVVGG
ncbi:hypothetical protein C8F01DRAFT_1173807 [Mycena amicta]|nr:hypothetical protein C8F01DRAFT_1173807 [Mycena amicta]